MRTKKQIETGPDNSFDDLLGATPAAKPPLETFSDNKETTTSPDLVTEGELADFWAVSSRQVRMLLSDAVIAKAEGKLFDKAACTKAYIQHLVASAKRRNGNDPELRVEKLRIAREQADQLELKNAAARGESVSASSVKAAWGEVLRDVRAGMLAIPSRVAQRLPHLTPLDLDHIDREIRDALSETAK